MRLKVNGQSVEVSVVHEETPLLWVLRDHLGLVGTKFGCGIGQCGACTVHIDGRPANACSTPVSAVGSAEVTTIEGLASDDNLHPLQQAWIDYDVAQCGYCQTGQIMRASALLSSNAAPTDDEIERAMAPNLCRCGTYNRIKTAVQAVAGTVGE